MIATNFNGYLVEIFRFDGMFAYRVRKGSELYFESGYVFSNEEHARELAELSVNAYTA